MSVIVKGMKMPKNCLHCDFDDSYGICACRNEAPYVCEYSAKQRPSWCPLEELPSAQPVDKDTNVHCTDTQPKNENEPLKTDQNAPFDEFISRKAAIDAVKKNTFRLTFAEEQNCEGHVAWSAEAVYSDVMEGALLELPSAHPEKRTEERTETHACDYISRQAAIDAFYEMASDIDHLCTVGDYVHVLEMLPSAQPERLTDDDFETIRIHLNAYKEKLCNQHRWEEANEYQRIIDRFMAFASAQPEQTNSWYINSWCNNCKEYDKEKHSCPRFNRVIKQTLDEVYAHAETEAESRFHAQQRWIPCSEKLPEANGRYLVTRGLNACGAMWNRVYIANYSNLMGLKSVKIWWQGNVGKSDFERLDDVLAWMPLPETYREEGD